MRKEQDIFNDLAQLCSSPGYVHAIAHLCFRDNIVGYAEEMTAEDILPLFSEDRLIRTEMSILIGLLVKEEVECKLPASSVVQQYLDKTLALLEELHSAMSVELFCGLDPKKIAEEGFNPFTKGEALREPIFYGGESAFSFQYRDLSPKKHTNDDEWLEANKGFSMRTARDVVHAIEQVLNEKLFTTLKALKKIPLEEWTLLPGYTFTAQEVAGYSGIDKVVVERVLLAFAVPEGEKNSDFCALNDFNVTNAFPLLSTIDDSFILFQTYSLVEALYETPFYWMCADKSYVNDAMQHRGQFTEEFSRERLELVFGKENVYSNIDIFKSKGKKLGEIDVLVLFGNRAIVLQAKSKRLTLEARRGNDGQIKDDFKKSIQDSYNQGYTCAKLLTDAKCKLMNADSREITIPQDLKEVYIFCVVSDHYPALSFQSRQFLKFETTEAIHPPFIMDVFLLDTMTEMLQSPLRLLSYANKRANYYDKLIASHELTILAYHLKYNLWVENQHDLIMLDDDISADLDIAMTVRRNGIPGKRTPDGVLTRYKTTALGRFIDEIEAKPNPATIDLGFLLLTLSEDAITSVSKGIDKIAREATKDRQSHDLTVGFKDGSTGLTIHCNDAPHSIAGPKLQAHCEVRKYTEQADSWFGVCIHPENALLRFGTNLSHKWEQSAEMDAITRKFPRKNNLDDLIAPTERKKKIGRNEPCPCGSGIKYKKCCFDQ